MIYDTKNDIKWFMFFNWNSKEFLAGDGRGAEWAGKLTHIFHKLFITW